MQPFDITAPAFSALPKETQQSVEESAKNNIRARIANHTDDQLSTENIEKELLVFKLTLKKHLDAQINFPESAYDRFYEKTRDKCAKGTIDFVEKLDKTELDSTGYSRDELVEKTFLECFKNEFPSILLRLINTPPEDLDGNIPSSDSDCS